MVLTQYYIIIITLKTATNQKKKEETNKSLLHFGTEQELEQGTVTGDIAAGDPPSDLASSVPALILPTPDGPDPPSDLASSVPALILPTPDGPDPPSDLASSVPALILPTPDGPDPPSDLASSVPALSLPTPDGPALSDPTPDGYTHKHGAELWKYKLAFFRRGSDHEMKPKTCMLRHFRMSKTPTLSFCPWTSEVTSGVLPLDN